MKIRTNIFIQGLAMLAAAVLSASCGTEVVRMDYPEQRLYIPAAVEDQVYVIDQVEISTGNTPTEGSMYQFLLNPETGILTVPLSVYRAGIGNDGAVDVEVWIDDEPVYDAILAGSLPEDIRTLPADLCEWPGRLRIEDGSSSVRFSVQCLLEYLLDSPQRDRQVAFGVSISSDDREVNPDCGSVAIVIDPSIFDELGL